MSNTLIEKMTCPNPDCRIAETGKCVEGFDVAECPHQKAAVVVSDTSDLKQEEMTPDAEIETRHSDVLVGSGGILTIEEATDVLRRRPTRVLTIIGPLNSGKTTLGLSIYTAFQEGPFDRWSFGGSLTLVAFEERCHWARMECGNWSPDTLRTPVSDGLGFLHLALHAEDSGIVDLLISDRSGEFYTAVADSQEDCEDLHEVSRADLVLFLVDGEKLAGDERHGVKVDISVLLETLVEENALSGRHRVGIVLTKYDLVMSSDLRERVMKDFDTLLESFRIRFGSKLGEIKAFKIAARPENSMVPPRFGVLEIIEECIRPHRFVDYVPSSTGPILDRCFLRLRAAHGGPR